MHNLSHYDISENRGFLASYNPETVTLPDYLQPIRTVAMDLPRLIPTGRIRTHLETMPALDLTEFCETGTDAQKRMAMVHYSFMVQAYVWGEPDAPSALPAGLALPIWQLAKSLGQQPLLPYSGYVLDNWGLVSADGPLDLSNIYMIQPFIGGQDEAWFVLVHVAIEARAGEMLAAMPGLIEAAKDQDEDKLIQGLSLMETVWNDINDIFNRMPERCDPYVYFHRVRPWIHGWKDNPALGPGLIYEGVAQTHGEPQAFRGQTGSQSSIVPSVDAFLGITHASDPMRTFLDELHMYRPPAHRNFIDDLRAESTVRDFVQSRKNAELTELYNTNIRHLTRFRTRHLEYAALYINKQATDAPGNDTDVGTGGTPFMKYLKKHRDEADAHVLHNLL